MSFSLEYCAFSISIAYIPLVLLGHQPRQSIQELDKQQILAIPTEQEQNTAKQQQTKAKTWGSQKPKPEESEVEEPEFPPQSASNGLYDPLYKVDNRTDGQVSSQLPKPMMKVIGWRLPRKDGSACSAYVLNGFFQVLSQ